MANNCYFDMNIVGKESAINELIDMIEWKGCEERPGLGRVFSIEVYDREVLAKDGEQDIVSVRCSGDCAWSVYSSMLNDGSRYPNLESETKRLGLALEVYSSEPGIGFQEHYVIDKGKILEEEEREYQEHWIEMMQKDHVIEVCEANHIPYEKLDDYINDNGDLCIGGFEEEFGSFRDLSEYVLKAPVLEAEEEYTNAYKLAGGSGTEYTVYPHLNSYIDNDNLYVGLEYDDSEQGCRDFYGDVTVNVGNLPYLESAVDVNNNGNGILAFLVQNGFGEPTGKALSSGFCTYPVFRFNEEKLKEIDPGFFAEYAKLYGKDVSKDKVSLDAKIQDAKMRQNQGTVDLDKPEPDKDR